jgi:hypothetical protein
MRRTRTGLDCPFRPVSACTRVDSPFHPQTHDLILSESSHLCAAVSFLFQSQDSHPTHLRASAVQMVRGLSSADLLPEAALPLSCLNWFVTVYIYRCNKNPLNFPKLPKRGIFYISNYPYPLFYSIVNNAYLFFFSCKLIRRIA